MRNPEKILSQIQRVAQTAPLLEDLEAYIARMSDTGIRPGFEDDQPIIHEPYDPDQPLDPGMVDVAMDEFPTLLELLGVLEIPGMTDLAQVGRLRAHERGHARYYAECLGATVVRHGVVLMEDSSENVVAVAGYTMAYGLTVPALAVVGAAVYPLHSPTENRGGPSTGDLKALETMGITGTKKEVVQQVGRRLERWNEDHELKLWLPSTYDPADSPS